MQLRNSQLKIAIMLFIGLLFIVQPSWAGRVVKVKGKKVYILLDQEELDSTFKGDNLYLTTPSGKKRGLVVIRKMRGRKVIAQLKKGKAKKKMLTRMRKAKKKKRMQEQVMEEASEVAETETESSERSDMMFGVLGTYGIASQKVTGLVDTSGSLLGFKAAFDYSIVGNLGVQARLGLDMLSVSGDANSISYATDISYLTLDFFLRYYFMRGDSFGFFGNVGMGIYSPMSKDLGSTAALQEDSISTTSVIILGLGVAIPIGSWEIQVGGDYYFFPPSDDVKTNVIGAKVGLMFDI